MIDKKVEIKLPRVWFGKLEESYFLGEKKVIAISNNFGVIKRGLVIQMMSQSTATHLLQLFLKEKILEFGELGKSALLEISNILAGGMVSSIADLIGEIMSMEPPKMSIGTPLSIIKTAIEKQKEILGWTCFSSANIYAEGKEEISLLSTLFPFFDIVKDLWKMK
jgi:chemotaxis protein CheY-P-specific phosphatase CheC